VVTVPVRAIRDGDILVAAGHADRKRWWRHFREPAAAQVWYRGTWHSATGQVTPRSAAVAADRHRFPRTPLDNAFLVELTCAGLSPEPEPLRGNRLRARWFTVVTAGEFLGFCVPATVGALTAPAPAAVVLAAVLAAGGVEGTLLGLAQASVLRRALPAISTRRWVGATAAAAVVAYALGMLPSTLAGRLSGLPPVVLIGAAVVFGAALLLSIGVAQWLVFRAVLPRSVGWIATTAAAWSAGLAGFLGFAMPLWQPGQPVPVIVAIGAAGGLLMAAITSAITGEGLRRLLDRNVT
jgi:hypothetical protein